MESLKIGKNVIEVLPGDYIQSNGFCDLFCSGNGRYLSGKGWDRRSYVYMTKKSIKEIDFSKMKHTESVENGVTIDRWYF